jgi:hypothetical protein
MKKRLKKGYGTAKAVIKSTAVRKIGVSLPGVGGLILVSLGAALIYLPAGLIVSGLLLFKVDARL